MPGESYTTTDHELIRQWAEERGGRPARVGANGDGSGIGILRFNFLGNGDGSNDELEETSWENFFDTFEKKKLALLYQKDTAEGQQSRFFKFVQRD